LTQIQFIQLLLVLEVRLERKVVTRHSFLLLQRVVAVQAMVALGQVYEEHQHIQAQLIKVLMVELLHSLVELA
jgi:hypothetical protein